MKLNTKALLPGLAVGVFGLLLAVQYSAPQVRTAQAERTRLEGEIQRLSADAAALPAEQDRQRRLTRDYAVLQAGLPDDEQLPAVLETLAVAASRLGITTGKLSRAVRASDVRGVTAVDLNIEIAGTYARTQALIQTLAALPRAYTARAISLSAKDDGTITGTLNLTTYKRESTPAPPPPTDPASVTPGVAGAATPGSEPVQASTPGGPQ
jgi:type IV pilus assembly protein PilO